MQLLGAFFNRAFDRFAFKTSKPKAGVLVCDLRFPEGKSKNSMLCFFAHFDTNARIHGYVVYLIESLKAAGCDIVFVTASGEQMESSELRKLDGLVVGTITRNNFGYDFGSWKAGIDCCLPYLEHYQYLAFTNDSVYGPFADLSDTIQSMVKSGCDVWAMTDSYERAHHIQSYFWGLDFQTVEHGFFERFWQSGFRYCSGRDEAIEKYELTILNTAVSKYGLKVGAYVMVEDLIRRFGLEDQAGMKTKVSKVNPVHDYALRLVRDCGVPLVKRELIEKNPRGYEEINELLKYLHESNPKAFELMLSHLRQSTKNVNGYKSDLYV